MKIALVLAGIFTVVPPSFTPQLRGDSGSLPEKVVYFGAGGILGSVSLLAQVGWGLSLLTPLSRTVGNECLALSHICDIGARYAFMQVFKGGPTASSYTSWERNRKFLNQIPAHSNEEKELILFLQKRWLAKTTGLYPGVADWIAPCFGIDVQIHPDSTNSYSRDPANKFSQTYTNVVKAWKHLLPQDLPLILTRPVSVMGYLPPCISMTREEEMGEVLERIALEMDKGDLPVLIDCTQMPLEDRDWQKRLVKACQERHLSEDKMFAIQRLQREAIGAIRLIPLFESTSDALEEKHQFLLEWVSKFGLSANRVELDRFRYGDGVSGMDAPRSSPLDFCSREELLSYLGGFDLKIGEDAPHKALMLKGTMQLLRGLLTEKKWDEIDKDSAQFLVAQFSFAKIREELALIKGRENALSFFDFVSHIEQVHSYLSNALEIAPPYSESDFPAFYADLLTLTPEALQPLTSYAVHVSGMASLAGILKAVKDGTGKTPRVLYGENSYFENIYAAQRFCHATPLNEAVDGDWGEVDLLLAQFNPALRRIDFKVTDYQVEEVADGVRKSLRAKKGEPLTLALDCTLDFLDSPRVGTLLAEFQKEIEEGLLNVICYRSGIKYDLFGMDNYCGAPFYMIHSPDVKWAAFDALLVDPALKTDSLSFNWFCLAFKHAADQLELYRKQIFSNTRAFLDRVPKRLFQPLGINYRIVPIAPEADASFVDIKVFGPLHALKGSLFVGGLLTLKCMEAGHPIFHRPSLGFYHPNFSVLFSEECTTVRLTLGLDPSQVDLLVDCFSMLDTLNGSPWQILRDKVFRSI